MRLSKPVLAFMALLVLAGCARERAKASFSAVPPPMAVTQAVEASPYAKKIAVGAVSGGQGFMLHPSISNEDVLEALKEGLAAYGLLAAEENPPYVLDATVTKIDQPFIGWDHAVVTSIDYVVRERVGGAEVFRTSQTAEFVARGPSLGTVVSAVSVGVAASASAMAAGANTASASAIGADFGRMAGEDQLRRLGTSEARYFNAAERLAAGNQGSLRLNVTKMMMALVEAAP